MTMSRSSTRLPAPKVLVRFDGELCTGEGKGTSTARDVLETREMEAEASFLHCLIRCGSYCSGHRKDGQTDIDLALDAITAAALPGLRDLPVSSTLDGFVRPLLPMRSKT